MNILYISNYDAHHRIAEGWMPEHHLFGIYSMIDYFETPETAIVKKSFGRGKIDFLVISNPSYSELLKIYLRALHYDIVYDVLNVVSKYFGLLNKWHLFPPRLITIIHHPPFRRMMTYAKSDVSIFFTDKLMNEARKFVKDNRKIIFNNWYPDVEWYVQNKRMMETEKVYDFLDNGKTARDHDLFIRSMEYLPDKRGIIVTDKNHIPSTYRPGGNIDLFFQDKPNDLTMQQLCMKTRVMVIPLIEGKYNILGPIGVTSYMDAIALGMPVVTTDNAAFADEIRINGLGITYESVSSNFSNQLKDSLEHYEVYATNINKFRENHTIQQYSDKFIRVLNDF